MCRSLLAVIVASAVLAVVGWTSPANYQTSNGPQKPTPDSSFSRPDRSLPIVADTGIRNIFHPAPLISPFTSVQTKRATEPRAIKSSEEVTLAPYFEANVGQSDERVKFLSRGRASTLFLTETEAVMVLHPKRSAGSHPGSHKRESDAKRVKPQNEDSPREAVLSMKLVGANPAAKITGLDELPGKSNYFIGHDPSKWRTNVPHYARVKYEGVYPGVDMIFYENQQQLEYDFVVAPGADPAVIKLAFKGADKIETDRDGRVVLHTAVGQVQLQKPRVYQETDGIRREIAGSYLFNPRSRIQKSVTRLPTVSFQLAAYDRGRPLVIDPVMEYSTYLGGSGNDRGHGVAVDAAGNVYVTGSTSSSDFPRENALDQSFNGGGFYKTDVVVAKIDPAGKNLIYSTYLGGSGDDFSAGIGVDAEGNAYLVGDTASADFSTTVGAYQTNRLGDNDVFIAKIDTTGSILVYSTYLGGSCTNSNASTDSAGGVALDGNGNAYVTGSTECHDFPTTVGVVQPIYGGGLGDAFVAKINSTGSSLVYSTFLGGRDDESGNGIAIDQGGSAYITGYTASANYPTTGGAFQTKRPGEGDAFVTKLSPDGSRLVYSTFLGGSSGGFIAFDWANAIAVDSKGVAYVTGTTSAGNFPVLNAIQPSRRGDRDGFVSAISPDGSDLVYSTYLGGRGGSGADSEEGSAIAVDSLGNAYITGQTPSSDFPTTSDALQSTKGGSSDAFITQLAPDGALLYSSYLGGSGNDSGDGIAVHSTGEVVVTGQTASDNFPLVNALQPTKGNATDIFVTKISVRSAPAQPSISISDVWISEGNSGTVDAVFTVSLSFAGTSSVTVTFSTADDSATAGSDYVATSGNLTFNPGETTKTISVQVNGDTVDEVNETFFVNLTSATHATIADGQGIGTIVNDDGLKVIAVNCPFESLQAALAGAESGDTISVTGSCDENVLVDNNKIRVFLQGNGATLFGQDPNKPALDIRGKAIFIGGFTVTGAGDGIVVQRGSNVVLDGNVVQNTGGSGIVVNQLAFAILTNNTIQNNPKDGVIVADSASAHIGFNNDTETVASPNVIKGNGGFGVVVGRSSSARIIGNTISGNTGGGVMVVRKSHADIANNAIDGNSGDGVLVSDNSTVSLGEDSGSTIYALPNSTGTSNGGVGVLCMAGGVADGRLGKLNGNGGAMSFDSSCINSLSP
jgi:parallel beta-helix repeat protein